MADIVDIALGVRMPKTPAKPSNWGLTGWYAVAAHGGGIGLCMALLIYQTFCVQSMHQDGMRQLERINESLVKVVDKNTAAVDKNSGVIERLAYELRHK